MSPPVQSRSLRSVVEVHSLQPVSSMDRHMETTTNIISKTHIRPEYADMDPLHHNRSYGDQEHHHGDPITGHTAMLGWHNSRPCHQKDKKWCHRLNGQSIYTCVANFFFDVFSAAHKFVSLFLQNPTGSDETSIMFIYRELSMLW